MIVTEAMVIGQGPYRPGLPCIITPEPLLRPGEPAIAAPLHTQVIEHVFWCADRLGISRRLVHERHVIQIDRVDWEGYQTRDPELYSFVLMAGWMRVLLEADFKLFWWPHVLG